jgi:AcrR family transcriptional regulator
LRLLDRDGLDALSMRRGADELGTGAASLYWHVGSKDGLLDLVFDRVIGEQPIPAPDPKRWKEQLKEVARAQRSASIRHP